MKEINRKGLQILTFRQSNGCGIHSFIGLPCQNIFISLNPLSANPTKWPNTLNIVGLAHNGLKLTHVRILYPLKISENQRFSEVFKFLKFFDNLRETNLDLLISSEIYTETFAVNGNIY